MFFAGPGKYEACNLFTVGHFILAFITILGVIIALKCTLKNITKEKTKKIIRNCTIFVWIFEIVIMTFKISTGGIAHVNNYVPLYFCSMLLYAGAFSAFTNGTLKRIGDVFLASGGIIGGATYLLYPITSLATYPMFHLVSVHSFIFHGIMVYLGLLMNITNYIEIKLKDIKYYFTIIAGFSFMAYIINQIFDSNLMFISKNYPGNAIINYLYNATGNYFALVMILGQATLPFYLVYGLKKVIDYKFIKKGEENK